VRGAARSNRTGLHRLTIFAGLRTRELGEAEVEDLNPPVRGDEQVLRLDVAVDDPLGVGRLQAARRLDCRRDISGFIGIPLAVRAFDLS
jgi:hypothetical protein